MLCSSSTRGSFFRETGRCVSTQPHGRPGHWLLTSPRRSHLWLHRCAGTCRCGRLTITCDVLMRWHCQVGLVSGIGVPAAYVPGDACLRGHMAHTRERYPTRMTHGHTGRITSIPSPLRVLCSIKGHIHDCNKSLTLLQASLVWKPTSYWLISDLGHVCVLIVIWPHQKVGLHNRVPTRTVTVNSYLYI